MAVWVAQTGVVSGEHWLGSRSTVCEGGLRAAGFHQDGLKQVQIGRNKRSGDMYMYGAL